MWPYSRRQCEQVLFIAQFDLHGIPFVRWTDKGNHAIGTAENRRMFLRFKIKPKTRNCFIKTPNKSPTIQIPKWAWLTHTVKKSPVFSAFCMAAPVPAASSSSSCWRWTWIVSSCSSQLSSPLLIAEVALHLRGFILINKVLWPKRRGLYKVQWAFFWISPDNTHSSSFLFSSAYQRHTWVSPVEDHC